MAFFITSRAMGAAATPPVSGVPSTTTAIATLGSSFGANPTNRASVSYPHVDVYKRQVQEVLGHASLATRQRYAGVTTRDIQVMLRRGHPRG